MVTMPSTDYEITALHVRVCVCAYVCVYVIHIKCAVQIVYKSIAFW